MKDNPYSKMIEMIKREGASYNPPSIQIAEVIEPPPNLIIRVNDLQIDKDNILIADYLLKEYKRRIVISGERIKFTQTDPPMYIGTTTRVNDGGMNASDHDHTIKDINIDTKLSPTPQVLIEATRKDQDYIKTVCTLERGDLLAVMPVYDRQLYIILARLKEVS